MGGLACWDGCGPLTAASLRRGEEESRWRGGEVRLGELRHVSFCVALWRTRVYRGRGEGTRGVWEASAGQDGSNTPGASRAGSGHQWKGGRSSGRHLSVM